MKSCFEGHKRRRIYHPHKSPIICVILFSFFLIFSFFGLLPLLEDTGEIRRPDRLRDCPHRQHENGEEEEVGEGSWRAAASLLVRSKRIAGF